MSTIEQKVKEDLEKNGFAFKDVQQEEQEPTRTLTPFELEQQKKGWSPNGRKTAEEWAENEPLANELRAIRQENKRYQETVDQLKAYLDKQESIVYQKAIEDLKNQRENAIKRGDVDEVERLDQQRDSMKGQPVEQKQETPKAVSEFYEKHNSWINGTTAQEVEMMAYAQERDAIIKSKNLPPEKHMQLLEECVMTKFPDYFSTGETKKTVEYVSPVSVESGINYKPSVKTKKYSRADLSDDQKEVLMNFERFKVMDERAYIEGLVQSGQLK